MALKLDSRGWFRVFLSWRALGLEGTKHKKSQAVRLGFFKILDKKL